MRKFIKFCIAVLVIVAVAVGVVGCTQLGKDTKVTNPAALTQGLSTDKGLSLNNSTGPSASDLENMQVVNEQIVADFKADISALFKAWKSADMEEFRKYAALGYTGTLFDNKVAEAEEFILEAAGADVTNTNYKNIKVIKAEGNAAVLECEFDYSGYEYNLAAQTRGENFGPRNVKREYSLELKDNHWYITLEKDLAQN